MLKICHCQAAVPISQLSISQKKQNCHLFHDNVKDFFHVPGREKHHGYKTGFCIPCKMKSSILLQPKNHPLIELWSIPINLFSLDHLPYPYFSLHYSWSEIYSTLIQRPLKGWSFHPFWITFYKCYLFKELLWNNISGWRAHQDIHTYLSLLWCCQCDNWTWAKKRPQSSGQQDILMKRMFDILCTTYCPKWNLC